MNRIAFVFSSSPHGTASGREGLDALLATSTLTKNIGVFFIGDGIFQIIAGQQPHNILMRDYISTFKILPLYDIKIFCVCAVSLETRGLTKNIPMVLDTMIVDPNVLHEKLASYDVLLNF